MIIGTAVIAGISGYMIGIASSLGLIPIPFMPKAAKARGIDNYDDEEESEEEDIDEGILDHAPNWANGVEADKRDGLRNTARKEVVEKGKTKRGWEDSTSSEECKLVLVVRTDLGMTKGMFLLFVVLLGSIIADIGRQNRCTVRTRNSRKLQIHPTIRPSPPPKMGTHRPSQGCPTGQERGRDDGSAGYGYQPGPGGGGH